MGTMPISSGLIARYRSSSVKEEEGEKTERLT